MAKKRKKGKGKKATARQPARVMPRTYEAAQITRFRKQPTFSQSADAAVNMEAGRLRAWARYLCENMDVAKGIIDTLTNQIVGTGIVPEPMVMQKNGKPAARINKQILDAWNRWAEAPDVTGEFTLAEAERKVCYSMLRDGEMLVQLAAGRIPGLEHRGGIPLSLELIESDYLPYEHTETRDGVVHGVRKNAWGRPVAYFLYKEHPGNVGGNGVFMLSSQDMKEVAADRILHVKMADRVKQTRGTTCLHSVITRLDDLKNFEESERVKARVQAAFCAAIVKEAGMGTTDVLDDSGNRTFQMDPGMIFDGLLPGESITNIESKSPTPLLKDFRKEMLRAAAAGTGTAYSSISKDYDGSYSSARQELVEAMPAYKRMRRSFINQFSQPVYRAFIDMAVMSGRIAVPRSMQLRDLYAVDFGDVVMPWIDPQKEANAYATLLENNLESREAIIRARGRDPRTVNEQIKADELKPEPAAPAADMNDTGSDDSDSDDAGSDDSDSEVAA